MNYVKFYQVLNERFCCFCFEKSSFTVGRKQVFEKCYLRTELDFQNSVEIEFRELKENWNRYWLFLFYSLIGSFLTSKAIKEPSKLF